MVDAICDLLIEENLAVAFVARTGNPDNIRAIAQHPAQMVGSDGLMTGDHPNPRTYGTFPYILGAFARDEGLLRLEDAVRRMTSAPAQRLGLPDPRPPARRHESRYRSIRPAKHPRQRHL